MSRPRHRRVSAGRAGVLAALTVTGSFTVTGCVALEDPGVGERQPASSAAPSDPTPTDATPSGTLTPDVQPRIPGMTVDRSTVPPQSDGPGTAAAQLATLAVAGRAPMTGYDRNRFGQEWLDADRNGCDTRNDILRRDLQGVSVKPGTNGCVISTGVLADPYTGTRIPFERAVTYSVDIDHVVALGNAWASGAWRFGIKKRAALANDPLNLLAVDAGSNRQKGDANAASWLPRNKGFRCAYVARQIAVKAKYRLAVTAPERVAMAGQLARCPGESATPDVAGAPTRVDQNISDPGAARPLTTTPPPTRNGSGAGSVYYKNCDAARAAGASPVRRGDPGYASHLDRDGDGVACE